MTERTARTWGEQSSSVRSPQARLVGAKARRRQDVQLEADPRPRSQPALRQPAVQLGQRRDRFDHAERRLGARPLEHAADEQHRLTAGRHQEVRLLVRPGEVGEIRVLDDHRAVQAVRAERLLQAPDAPVDLLSRDHGGYRSRP